MMSFLAKYPGLCDDCDTKIEVGDLVLFNERDTIAHADCPATAPAAAVCPTCYTEMPKTGVCDYCG
jgi:hypothetical protein